MASPSSPSVRFTALDAPTITSTAKGMKKKERSTSTVLRNGMASWLRRPAGEMSMISHAATTAMTTAASSLILPGTPLELRLVTFR